ncbi:MAG: DUF262 domain-containing protein [Deltaproteobacteria bacterium]|nr:DUF262 domain-containing protein [Deltaproteobacteria bacterium]
MSLIEELEKAKQNINSDGYEMSIGELINLYRDGDIIISPAYQRLFRWEEWQQTSFIESLLIEIPTPPIFVHQDDSGTWEIIDGLQRTSTILKFTGHLKDADGQLLPATVLQGTKLAPSLNNKRWDAEDDSTGLGEDLKRSLKRTRIRVEILKPGSGPKAKYELFQRLNTGGSPLSEQEVRNCVARMINPEFQDWLENCRIQDVFTSSMKLSDRSKSYQTDTELLIRFFAFRNIPYQSSLDVHEYLDNALIEMASNSQFPYENEYDTFLQTFSFISSALGVNAFQKWNGTKFYGKFLLSAYEIITHCISFNIDKLSAMQESDRGLLIRDKVIELWNNPDFTKNSGMGISGKARLSKLLPIAKKLINF